MTCVARGSMIEILNENGVVLRPIEELRLGDFVDQSFDDSVPCQIVDVMWLAPPCSLVKLCHYMGLRACPQQTICQNGNTMLCQSIREAAPNAAWEMCDIIFAVVLENARHARIDGVVCETLDRNVADDQWARMHVECFVC